MFNGRHIWALENRCLVGLETHPTVVRAVVGVRRSNPFGACCPSDDLDGTGDASDLTCGEVVCGNPSKALRLRRSRGRDGNGAAPNPTFFSDVRRTLSAVQLELIS